MRFHYDNMSVTAPIENLVLHNARGSVLLVMHLLHLWDELCMHELAFINQ